VIRRLPTRITLSHIDLVSGFCKWAILSSMKGVTAVTCEGADLEQVLSWRSDAARLLFFGEVMFVSIWEWSEKRASSAPSSLRRARCPEMFDSGRCISESSTDAREYRRAHYRKV